MPKKDRKKVLNKKQVKKDTEEKVLAFFFTTLHVSSLVESRDPETVGPGKQKY